MSAPSAAGLQARVESLLERRLQAGERFFAANTHSIAALCRACADRFSNGGRLIAMGASPAARSDVRHVAVEFVHPVIVGKRALPAIGLAPEGGPLPQQVDLTAESGDIAMAFGTGPETIQALAIARERGCLTVGFGAAGAEWAFDPGDEDPFVCQEITETLYHVVWELVHVFLEHGGTGGAGAGASSFLYPFLEDPGDSGAEALLADVAASVDAKAAEVARLRAGTLGAGREQLVAAAWAIRAALDAGGRVLALGNGGSATDAMDAVADFRQPPAGWPARRALDLTEDAAILTAVANDVGFDAVFARQVIAHGRSGDVLLAISTSGGSVNVLAALAESRRRGLTSVALVGYDGGRIVSERLADFTVVTPSEHIPRIQEAQASVLHVLRELVECCAR